MACIDRDIIIYHTETKKDYDALIDDLDKKGYMWQSFMPLKFRDYWGFHQEKTCIGVRSEGKNVFCSSFSTLIHSYEIYKYEAKEDTEVKIYHTETQEDYDALMIELEEQGCKWLSGRKPTEAKYHWFNYGEKTCVRVSSGILTKFDFRHSKENYPSVPIIKYKAKVDDKMKFTKENVEKVIDEYFRQADFEPCGDLIAEINNLADTPKKVVVPKFVAEWIERHKESGADLQTMLISYRRFYDNINSYSGAYGKKAVQWYVDNPYKFIRAYEEGYTIEPEQLYYIPLPSLETSDGIQQVLSQRKGDKNYFASRPNDKLQQRFTKEELERVPVSYKFYATLIEEENECN